MSVLEWIAFITGVASVWLSVRLNIWNWPVAIVNVTLYAIVFQRAGLYSDMGLQVVYLVLSIYGWYAWLHGGKGRSELQVSRATPKMWLACGALGVLFWYVLATLTARLPGAAIPRLDAALTTVSLVAQWMMTKKVLENWLLWIAADLVYVPMFLVRKLPLTSVLYAVFLVLAVMGWREWRRSLEGQEVAVA
ncbi:MAG: hypothetical protein JWO05_3769 [Gemmatimonadetes bacterium]|nr:hypothetical protein [Gemmatimonadota bacterium]